MKGKPVDDESAAFTLPMQKRYVIMSMNVNGMFNRKLQTMAFGTITLASSEIVSTSSVSRSNIFLQQTFDFLRHMGDGIGSNDDEHR